jgi:hypothetical protein
MSPPSRKDSAKARKSDSVRKPAPYKVRFAAVSKTEAAEGLTINAKRENPTLTSRRLASDIQVKELWLTESQRAALTVLEVEGQIFNRSFMSTANAHRSHKLKHQR